MTKAVQYFNFQNSKAAIQYYKDNLNAEVVSIQMGDDEMFAGSDMPGSIDGDFVMHAEIKILGHSFYISDTWNKQEMNNDGAMVCFTFNIETEKETIESFYQQAVDAGMEVRMPLGETEWTSMFGSLKDKFGVEWMFSGE